jgi:hypothetical protein
LETPLVPVRRAAYTDPPKGYPPAHGACLTLLAIARLARPTAAYVTLIAARDAGKAFGTAGTMHGFGEGKSARERAVFQIRRKLGDLER